jgi:hypothetical protein
MRYMFSLVVVLLFLGVAFAQKPVDRKSITHLNVESDHIVMLRTEVVPNNNMQANFFYDAHPLRPFGSVPKGFSFVVMDINVIPEALQISATDQYLLVINVNGGRSFTSWVYWSVTNLSPNKRFGDSTG